MAATCPALARRPNYVRNSGIWACHTTLPGLSLLLVTGAALAVAPNILSERCTGGASRMTVRAVVIAMGGIPIVTDPASIARLLAALRRSRDPPVAA